MKYPPNPFRFSSDRWKDAEPVQKQDVFTIFICSLASQYSLLKPFYTRNQMLKFEYVQFIKMIGQLKTVSELRSSKKDRGRKRKARLTHEVKTIKENKKELRK